MAPRIHDSAFCALRNVGALGEEDAQSAGRAREGHRVPPRADARHPSRPRSGRGSVVGSTPLGRARGEGRALGQFLASLPAGFVAGASALPTCRQASSPANEALRSDGQPKFRNAENGEAGIAQIRRRQARPARDAAGAGPARPR